jgi:hypothetical protein
MKLMMYIGNDLIETIYLDDKHVPEPGYLGRFKRSLKLKYSELIKQIPQPPEFLVKVDVEQREEQRQKG